MLEADWEDPEVLERFIAAGVEAVAHATRLTATEVWGNIGREAPTDHGRLAGSFEMMQRTPLEWVIWTNVLYAIFVHDGTGIHGPIGEPITPVSSSVLVFEYQGETVFARSVEGQHPNPFADRAVRSAEDRATEFMELAVAATMEEHGVG